MAMDLPEASRSMRERVHIAAELSSGAERTRKKSPWLKASHLRVHRNQNRDRE